MSSSQNDPIQSAFQVLSRAREPSAPVSAREAIFRAAADQVQDRVDASQGLGQVISASTADVVDLRPVGAQPLLNNTEVQTEVQTEARTRLHRWLGRWMLEPWPYAAATAMLALIAVSVSLRVQTDPEANASREVVATASGGHGKKEEIKGDVQSIQTQSKPSGLQQQVESRPSENSSLRAKQAPIDSDESTKDAKATPTQGAPSAARVESGVPAPLAAPLELPKLEKKSRAESSRADQSSAPSPEWLAELLPHQTRSQTLSILRSRGAVAIEPADAERASQAPRAFTEKDSEQLFRLPDGSRIACRFHLEDGGGEEILVQCRKPR